MGTRAVVKIARVTAVLFWGALAFSVVMTVVLLRARESAAAGAILSTVVLGALVPQFRRWYREHGRPRGVCKECGYSVRGVESGLCPECGKRHGAH